MIDKKLLTHIIAVICSILILVPLCIIIGGLLGIDSVFSFFEIYFFVLGDEPYTSSLYPFNIGGLAGLILLCYKNNKLKVIGILGILALIFALYIFFNSDF